MQGAPQPLRNIGTPCDGIGEQSDVDNAEARISAKSKKREPARASFHFAETQFAASDNGVAKREDLQSQSCLYDCEVEGEVALRERSTGAPISAPSSGNPDGLRDIRLLP